MSAFSFSGFGPRLLRLLAAGALVIASASAEAAWERLGGHGGMTFFHDAQTMRRMGDVVTMWALIDFRLVQGQPPLKPYRSMRLLLEVDCRDGFFTRRAGLSLHGAAMATGEVVYADTDFTLWRPVPPATGAQLLQQAACNPR